ncbi:hypothetical protein EAO68_09720 [Streptomyces sp. wa22]|nr:hypothetical protein EAO68_09720 [Streptomyces sp. wa22]
MGRSDRPADELRRASALRPVGAGHAFDPGEISVGGTPDQWLRRPDALSRVRARTARGRGEGPRRAGSCSPAGWLWIL